MRQFRDTALSIPDFVRGVVRIGTISKSYRVRESVIADPMASRMSLPCQRCGQLRPMTKKVLRIPSRSNISSTRFVIAGVGPLSNVRVTRRGTIAPLLGGFCVALCAKSGNAHFHEVSLFQKLGWCHSHANAGRRSSDGSTYSSLAERTSMPGTPQITRRSVHGGSAADQEIAALLRRHGAVER